MVTSKRSESVLRRIFSEILKGKPDSTGKLQSAQVISQEYGISTASVREALKTLETIGIITLSHGRGIFVSDVESLVTELLDARKLIEGFASVKAAELRTDQDVARLDAVIAQMQSALARTDVHAYTRLDRELHLFISNLSNNRILSKVLDTLKLILFYQQIEVNKVPSLLTESHGYHEGIVAAIKAGDPEGAREQMEQHISSLIDYWTTTKPEE